MHSLHVHKVEGSIPGHDRDLFLIEDNISEFKSQKMQNAVKKFKSQKNELTINRQKCLECLRKEANSIEKPCYC